VGIEQFIKDDSILKVLEDKEKRTILVMGGSDTGKTTLVESLLAFLTGPRAIVDLDMGQSNIGVPTTVSWGKVSGRFDGLRGIKEEGFYFTGALSPPGNLLPAIVGARRMVDSARAACGKVVIDTTGLIDEPAGRVLKRYKIDLLLPDVIIGLESEKELSHILDPLKFQERPLTWRLPVPNGARTKSRVKRTEWRVEKFREYFKSARAIEVSLEETGIEFTREAVLSRLEGRVVSLRDRLSVDIALGVIEKAEAAKNRLVIRTPLQQTQKFSTVVIGSAVVNNI
jgi:polynucleotide 5'-kinase involved in rRNA processing